MRKIALLCLLATAARAQAPLRGVVQDSATQQPLAFASVFLTGTTLGVTTDDQGRFEFRRVPAGAYDLVGSYVGYRLSKQPIKVAQQAQTFTLRLASDGPKLEEVVVKAPPHKPEDFARFSELLLGRGTFSKLCRITNPNDVVVFVNDSTKELQARTKTFVEIENQALGYRIKYYGLRFSFDPQDETGTFDGEPVFEELTPRDEAQRQQWAANRATAYRGSLAHFLKAVYQGKVRTQGFLAQQVRLEPGPPVTARLYPTPLLLDSLRRIGPDGTVYLRFTHELQVAYFGEAPDPNYPQPMASLGPDPRKPAKPWPAVRQVSRLRLLVPEAAFEADGSLVDHQAVAANDYWAFEKIGAFLPDDYELPPSPPETPAKASVK